MPTSGAVVQHVRAWSALVALASLAAGLTVVGARSAGALVDLPRLLVSPTPSAAAELCLALAGAGACLAGAWLGLVAGVAALDHLRCRVPHRSAPLRPRLVRVLVGASLTCIGAQPAVAAGPDAPPLPVRPVSIREDVMTTLSAPSQPARAAAASTVRVRPGDALWSIAARLVPSDAAATDIDRAWRALYADNRERIGDDPDLLHPGTVLTVPDVGPAPDTETDTETDTDIRPTRSRHP